MASDDIIYDIPFPYQPFTDTKFILTETNQGSRLFIPDNCYTRINDTQIMFDKDNEIGIDENSELRFTFIHARNKRWLGKVEYHFTVETAGQKEFYFHEFPYNQLISVKKRIYVFYNRIRQINGINYYIDEYRGKIILVDKTLKSFVGDKIDVLIIYTGANNNGGIQELPQSGYIYINKYEIDRNYNPNLMAVFLNGRLIDEENILQMSNTVYKLVDSENRTISSRYNLDVKNLSPRISSLVPFYKQHCKFEKIPPNQEYYNILCRIEVPKAIPKGRKTFKPQFSPIYFNPNLIINPNLWINLIIKKSDVNYDLKMYGDDFEEEPTDINVIMQLRLQTYRKFIINSNTSSIVGVIPGHVISSTEDRFVMSIQVKTIIEMDTTRNGMAVDGIIGRLQANIRKYGKKTPLYYTFTSEGFNKFAEVSLFRWSISTEEYEEGNILWHQDFDFDPENKWELVREMNENG